MSIRPETADWSNLTPEEIAELGRQQALKSPALKAEREKLTGEEQWNSPPKPVIEDADIPPAPPFDYENEMNSAAVPSTERWEIPSADFWAAPGKPPEFLIPGYLPYRLALLAGKGGLGKSKLGLMLAVSVACRGEPWLRMPTGEPLRAPEAAEAVAVYATWEEDRDIVRYRLCDWPRADGNFTETLPALLGNRLDFREMRGPLWEATSPYGQSMLTPQGYQLLEYAKRREARLLIIDPLAAAFAGNENDRGQVRRFCAVLDVWAIKARCAVLLVGHPPKTNADYSGSTDWHNAARSVLTMSIKGEARKEPTLQHIKSNYGPKQPDLLLSDWRWWSAEQGVNAGKDYCRAVLDYLEYKPEGATKTQIKKQVAGKNEEVTKAVQELLDSGCIQQPGGERTKIMLKSPCPPRPQRRGRRWGTKKSRRPSPVPGL